MWALPYQHTFYPASLPFSCRQQRKISLRHAISFKSWEQHEWGCNWQGLTGSHFLVPDCRENVHWHLLKYSKTWVKSISSGSSFKVFCLSSSQPRTDSWKVWPIHVSQWPAWAMICPCRERERERERENWWSPYSSTNTCSTKTRSSLDVKNLLVFYLRYVLHYHLPLPHDL